MPTSARLQMTVAPGNHSLADMTSDRGQPWCSDAGRGPHQGCAAVATSPPSSPSPLTLVSLLGPPRGSANQVLAVESEGFRADAGHGLIIWEFL